MIKSFKILAQKDEKGFFIMPYDVMDRGSVLDNIRYHETEMKEVRNLMFAIVCAVNQNKLRETRVNGWTKKYVRINGVVLLFEHFFLDEKNDMLYETDTDDELLSIKRSLKIEKLKK